MLELDFFISFSHALSTPLDRSLVRELFGTSKRLSLEQYCQALNLQPAAVNLSTESLGSGVSTEADPLSSGGVGGTEAKDSRPSPNIQRKKQKNKIKKKKKIGMLARQTSAIEMV